VRAMILAAGLGTRLRPLSALRPKPALPVHGVPLVAALLAIVATGAGGCGYDSAAVHPASVRTIAIPIPENETYYTGFERLLADALVKEVQTRTPYRIASSDRAETTLAAQITGVETDRLSVARGTGLAQELLREVTVNFEWKDLRTGRILAARERFTAGDVYIPTQPVGERAAIANYAIAEELARDIVSALRSGW